MIAWHLFIIDCYQLFVCLVQISALQQANTHSQKETLLMAKLYKYSSSVVQLQFELVRASACRCAVCWYASLLNHKSVSAARKAAPVITLLHRLANDHMYCMFGLATVCQQLRCVLPKMLPGVLLPIARRSVTAYAEICSGAAG